LSYWKENLTSARGGGGRKAVTALGANPFENVNNSSAGGKAGKNPDIDFRLRRDQNKKKAHAMYGKKADTPFIQTPKSKTKGTTSIPWEGKSPGVMNE